MKKDKLVLADGTEIELEALQGLSALAVNTESINAACAMWEKFTQENLKKVTIKDNDDLMIGNYTDLVLDHVTGKNNAEGTIQIAFSLREKSIEELLTERVDALESGQKTHGEAIGDLGQVVSDMAEGGQ